MPKRARAKPSRVSLYHAAASKESVRGNDDLVGAQSSEGWSGRQSKIASFSEELEQISLQGRNLLDHTRAALGLDDVRQQLG
jgi:hypothetical protein